MSSTILNHAILGPVTDVWKGRVWRTAPLQIGAFGFVSPIEVETDSCAPSALQFDAMVRVANSTPEFKAEVERYMFEAYQDIRPTYLVTVGNPNYRRVLTMNDLPEIEDPREIWKVIGGLSSVSIDEKANLDFEFIPAFDPNHDFAVRFRDGKPYEIMIDG